MPDRVDMVLLYSSRHMDRGHIAQKGVGKVLSSVGNSVVQIPIFIRGFTRVADRIKSQDLSSFNLINIRGDVGGALSCSHEATLYESP